MKKVKAQMDFSDDGSICDPKRGLTKPSGAVILKTAPGELQFPEGRAVPGDGAPYEKLQRSNRHAVECRAVTSFL